MKWDEPRLDELIRRAADFRVILLHGDDVVLVAARARLLMQAIAASGGGMFAPVELAGGEHSRIGSEMASPMLGGNHRLVRLRDATDAARPSVETALESGAGATLLIEAGSLPTRSLLRGAVERSERGVAMVCRALDPRDLAKSVDRMMAEFGLRLNRETRELLLGFDSGAGPGELQDRLADAEKLVLLVAGSGNDVQPADVLSLQVGSGRAALDDLCFAVAAGRVRESDRQIEDVLGDGVAPAAVLRSLITHFGRVRAGRRAMEAGMAVEAAIAALRPPVFFRRVPEMREAIKRWGSDDLDAAGAALWRADRACRETGSPASTICRRVVLSLLPR